MSDFARTIGNLDKCRNTVARSEDRVGAVERISDIINCHTVTGDRYNPTTQAEIDTEQFAEQK